MRQAVEAQVLNPHCELGEQGLRQILTDVIEEVRQSISPDIDGADVLHSLLNAPWLQSLLRVYECLQRFLRASPAPALDYASGLSFQLLIDIRALSGCSEEAKELYRLLRQPHLQALLSAHDSVAQKDYEPVLPPMPDDLPDDEEATRIVCLVKNKQPLRARPPLPGPAPIRRRARSRWDALRRLTQQKLHHGGGIGAFRVVSPGVEGSQCSGVRRGSYPPTELLSCPSAPRPRPLPRCQPISSCQVCCSRSQCRLCVSNAPWEPSLNRSAPSVCSSSLIDNIVEELDSGDEESADSPSSLPSGRRWTVSPPCLTVPYYSNVDDYTRPALPPRLRSPRIHTAPPSPMRPPRVVDLPPVELAKQESLDELRTTVQLAASSMESSTKDIRLLGEKMAAATERMSDTVQDNSQALVLLTQVVDRLQSLLATTRTEVDRPFPVIDQEDGLPGKTAKGQEPRPSLTHQSRCSFPSSSSSSISTSLDAPSTSQATSCLSASCRGSARDAGRTKNAPVQQQKKNSKVDRTKTVLTNGLLEEPEGMFSTGRRDRSNQRRKRRTKTTIFTATSGSLQPLVPLGATIKRNEITGEIFIARIIHGGLADRSGLLHAGDRIMEVNGFPVDGMEPEQVIQIVQARSQGTIMFKVVPITERPVHSQTMLYVRAMADYSPQQDPTIPCADAGMRFKRGDILEIVDQTDALWWQARKLPSEAACAGLVPSTNLLKRKQRELWWSQPYLPHACIQTLSTVEEEEDLVALDEKCVEADEEAFESEELREDADDFSSNIEGVYLVGFRRSLRLCRRRSHSTTQPSCHTRCPSSCYSALNTPYEEVVRYQRRHQDAHRLIALLGPSGVGVNELRRRLIEMNPNIFQGAVPHTTRAAKGYEESGREYHFTGREVFDNMMYNNRFLEYGEYKGNLYGTSVESVREVLNSGKICVIDIEPNAIHAVRSHELKAYIIYVKPPPLERLRETRQNASITTNYYVNRPFKDEDFQEMEESARKMESQYWQFFDHVIVNDELQDSCVQLLTAVSKAQDEPQWVPASWIRPNAES